MIKLKKILLENADKDFKKRWVDGSFIEIIPRTRLRGETPFTLAKRHGFEKVEKRDGKYIIHFDGQEYDTLDELLDNRKVQRKLKDFVKTRKDSISKRKAGLRSVERGYEDKREEILETKEAIKIFEKYI